MADQAVCGCGEVHRPEGHACAQPNRHIYAVPVNHQRLLDIATSNGACIPNESDFTEEYLQKLSNGAGTIREKVLADLVLAARALAAHNRKEAEDFEKALIECRDTIFSGLPSNHSFNARWLGACVGAAAEIPGALKDRFRMFEAEAGVMRFALDDLAEAHDDPPHLENEPNCRVCYALRKMANNELGQDFLARMQQIEDVLYALREYMKTYSSQMPGGVNDSKKTSVSGEALYELITKLTVLNQIDKVS